MHTPYALLRFVGKAILSALGVGLVGDLLIDVLPEVARDVWDWWGRHRDSSQRRADIEALARTTPAAARQLAAAVVEEVAGDRPAPVREALTAYLVQVPATVRQTLRRPADPSGTTVPETRLLERPEDLLPFLPARLPRFKPGDRPLPGVDWELVELLGTGGFGEVWKARNPHFPAVPPVALKFCLDPASRALLLHEAAVLDRVMRQGRHPGIVALLHTYLDAEPLCLEYEYVEGGDLAGLIEEWHHGPGGPLPNLIERSTRLMRDLAAVVAHAHRLDPPIVHRDLKPANILLASGGRKPPGDKAPDWASSPGGLRPPLADCALKITDFGIGGVAASHAISRTRRGLTRAQFLLTAVRGAHTPLYASPQQMRGDPPDLRDDVHALGVIWYQLLTGDLAAGRPGGTRWLRRLAEQGVPDALIHLLGACFEDDAADRPLDAAALVELLDLAVAAPVEVKPISVVVPKLPPLPDNTIGALRCFAGHTSCVESVAFSPDGRLALSGSADRTVRLWDLETREELRRFEGRGRWVLSVAFSPDGQRVLCGSWDRTVRLWDVRTGRELHVFEGHAARVLSVAFSPDGRRALSGSADHTVRLWDVETGRELRCFTGSRDLVWCVAAFSRDGRRALSAGADYAVRLWDVATGKEQRGFEGHTGAVLAVAFSPDGRHVCSGGWDRTPRLWEADTGRVVRLFAGHADLVWNVAFSPDGRRLLSGGADHTVRLWDVATAKELLRFEGHKGSVHSVAFSPDGRRALSGGADGTVRLWGVPR